MIKKHFKYRNIDGFCGPEYMGLEHYWVLLYFNLLKLWRANVTVEAWYGGAYL
jgi:hypothetical protein